jgi:Ca2+-binding RTX toxin-like protein
LFSKRVRAVGGLVLVQLVVGAGVAQAATNVPEGQPLQAAVDAATPGDTLVVSGGHPEHVTVNKVLTLQGTGGATVGTSGGGFTVSSAGVTITGFTISTGGAGTGIAVTTGSLTAHFNRFAGNATAIAVTAGTADLANNWFGCNDGPGASGCEPVTGATATPYLRLSIATSTDAVGPDGGATIIASLRSNSDGTDLGAHALSGGSVAFATTAGSVTPSAALSQGAASGAFAGPGSPGTATVSATLDGATVSRDIRVLRPDSDGDGIADDVDCAPTDASKPAKDAADANCDGKPDTTIKLVLNTLTGTNAADKITGTDAAELLLGLGGDDVLDGANGNDRVFGGAGQDRVYGNVGDDLVNGGGGDDRVSGGKGSDVLEGSGGRDKLGGGSGNDLLVGGSGADTITDHSGDDTARGGTGDDRIDVQDGKAGDIASCGPGKDRAIVDRGDTVAKDCESVSRK